MTTKLAKLHRRLWLTQASKRWDMMFDEPKFISSLEKSFFNEEEFEVWYYMRTKALKLDKVRNDAIEVCRLLKRAWDCKIGEGKGRILEVEQLMRLMEAIDYLCGGLEGRSRRSGFGEYVIPNEGPGFYYYQKPGDGVGMFDEERTMERGRSNMKWVRWDDWDMNLGDDVERIGRRLNFIGKILDIGEFIRRSDEEENDLEGVVGGLLSEEWDYGGHEKVIRLFESIRNRGYYDQLRAILKKGHLVHEEREVVDSVAKDGKAWLGGSVRRDGLRWVYANDIYPWELESNVMGAYGFRGGPYIDESRLQTIDVGSKRKLDIMNMKRVRLAKWIGLVDDSVNRGKILRSNIMDKRMSDFRVRNKRAVYRLERVVKAKETKWLKENEKFMYRGMYNREEDEEVEEIAEEVHTTSRVEEEFVGRRLGGVGDPYKYMEKMGYISRDGKVYSKLKRKKYDYYYNNNNIMSDYYTVGREYWVPSKLYLEDAITDVDKIDREIILYEFYRLLLLRYEWPMEVILVSAVNGYDIGIFTFLIF
jgi:hypothetical protein